MSSRRLFVGYYALANSVFYVPILLLHAERCGLSAGRLLYLVTTFAVVVAVSEVPLGVLADLVDLRVSLVASSVCGGLGAIIFATASNFWGFGLGQVFVALSMSLSSGTSSAYLYELCRAQGLSYGSLESLSSSARYLALGTSGLLGGALYSRDPLLPFWLTVVTMALACAALLRLPALECRAAGTTATSLWQILREALHLSSRPGVASITAYGAFFLAVTGTLFWSYQPLLNGFGVAPEWFGLLYSGFFLVAGFGSRSAHRLDSFLGRQRSAPLLGLSLALALFALAGKPLAMVVGAALVVQFLQGWGDPTLRVMLQMRIESASRATLLSVRSMWHRILLAVVSAALGRLADLGELPFAMAILGIAVALVAATLGRRAGAGPVGGDRP